MIRFDNVTTVISNIQSRGRARHVNSKYVLMVSNDDDETVEKINKLELNEVEMNENLQEKMASEPNYELDHAITVTDDTFFEIESGAKITIFTSVSAIHQYCNLLPRDSFANLKPIFSTGPVMIPSVGYQGHSIKWVSSLQLPVNAPENCRFISGKPCQSFEDAKRVVALEAIKHLYAAGCFDQRLKPVRFKVGPVSGPVDYDDAVRAAQGIKNIGGKLNQLKSYTVSLPEIFTKKTFPFCKFEYELDSDDMVISEDSQAAARKTLPGEIKVKRGDIPEETKDGYITIFKLDDDGLERILNLAIVLPFTMPNTAINDTHMIMMGSKPFKVEFLPCNVPILIDSNRNLMLQQFSTALFFNALLRTPPPPEDRENEYLMPVIPLINGEEAFYNRDNSEKLESLVDWKTLEVVAKTHWANLRRTSLNEDLKDEEGFKYSHKVGGDSVQSDSNVIYDYAKIFAELGQELIVGDQAYWNRKYQVYKVMPDFTPFNKKTEGFDSVASFYKHRLRISVPIDENQPVLLAVPLPQMYQSGTTEKVTRNTVVHLIPQFCSPFPLSATLMTESAIFIPLIIQDLYQRLSTLEIQKRLNLTDVTTPALFQAAFTSSGTQFFENYERLEFLGDSYLKMHLSIHLFAEHPTRDEGWLTRSRIALERNKNLLAYSIGHHLPNALLPTSVSRKTWAPPMRYQQIVKISDKGAADIVEAVMGACIVANGAYGGGKALVEFFGTDFLANIADYHESMLTIYSPSIDSEENAQYQQLLKKLHDKLGYKFKNALLAVEAITHTSAVEMYGLSACFQRLEFLGDSILGFIIGHQLYQRSEKFNPGDLSNLKSELVSNQFLAVASLRIGLPKLIIHAVPAVAHALSEFGRRVEEAQKKRTKLTPPSSPGDENSESLFWNDLPPAPKIASDILEALIGAVFLDSGCDLDAVQDVIQRVLIQPWWRMFISDGDVRPAVSNPVRDLHLYVESSGCTEFYWKWEQIEGDDKYCCIIIKHKEVLAKAVATSKRIAKRMAAIEVAPLLKAMSESNLDNNCKCIEQKKKGVLNEDLNKGGFELDEILKDGFNEKKNIFT
ncbi:hypothetical protein HK100_010811 [Physocladia obscura]|uniref:Uncharacterized protein n=1 Tax=Physocladia obscura TaxID=109957 RepID=A0AAD5T9M2_9FUNG|nr:hypothetical protein HK100_010811 [Physocladia obscura]